MLAANICVSIPTSLLVAWVFSMRGEIDSTIILVVGYIYTFLLGATFVIDQTCRRVLVSDIVPASHLPVAFAMESIAMSSSNTIGSQLGGFVIEFYGGHSAYVRVLACMQFVSMLLVFSISIPAPTKRMSGDGPGIIGQLREGIEELRRNQTLQSILGVTIIGNFFFVGPFFPVVQVLAADMSLSPTLTGSLASARGCGGALAAVMVVATSPKRIGVLYWCG